LMLCRHLVHQRAALIMGTTGRCRCVARPTNSTSRHHHDSRSAQVPPRTPPLPPPGRRRPPLLRQGGGRPSTRPPRPHGPRCAP
jgi:hypothetical protein